MSWMRSLASISRRSGSQATRTSDRGGIRLSGDNPLHAGRMTAGLDDRPEERLAASFLRKQRPRKIHPRIRMPAVHGENAAAKILQLVEARILANQHERTMGGPDASRSVVGRHTQKLVLSAENRLQGIAAGLREENLRADRIGYWRTTEIRCGRQARYPLFLQFVDKSIPEDLISGGHFRKVIHRKAYVELGHGCLRVCQCTDLDRCEIFTFRMHPTFLRRGCDHKHASRNECANNTEGERQPRIHQRRTA